MFEEGSEAEPDDEAEKEGPVVELEVLGRGPAAPVEPRDGAKQLLPGEAGPQGRRHAVEQGPGREHGRVRAGQEAADEREDQLHLLLAEGGQ